MNRIKNVLTTCLLLAFFALLFSLSTSKIIYAETSLANKAYVDPKGYFRIVPPAGWKIQEYPGDPRGKVGFLLGDDVSLRVLINAVDFDNIDALIEQLKQIEQKLGLATNIKKIDFFGRQAVERSFSLKGLKFYAVDLLDGKVDHNLQFGATPDKFAKYHALVMKSMETYEPLKRNITDKEVSTHEAAKKLRLAQLMLEMGNSKLAMEYVKEGLDASPNHQGLIELKKKLESKK
jgi:hypothetical protein